MKHGHAISCLILLIFISVPFIIHAQVMYFGGQVESIQPCDDGLLLTVQQPVAGIIYLMWHYGELPYLMYVIPHPGQNLIGEASPVTETCLLGITPYGAGMPIEYHGESF